MDDTIPTDDERDDSLLDRLRDMPVGALDPNIIGDAGPTDIPPGTDPPGGGSADDGAEPFGGLEAHGGGITDQEA